MMPASYTVELQKHAEELKKSPSELVAVDNSMKGLDGITATTQIKAAHPGARVIMVTDYDEPPLREAARTAGACGCVLKEDLFEVGRLLDTYKET